MKNKLSITQITSTTLITKVITNKWFSAIIAFVLWGGWAFYNNKGSGVSFGLRAGFVQGGFSFISTIIMASLTEHLIKINGYSLLARIFSALLISFSSLSVIASIHYLAQTPNILSTIIPPGTVALTYCILYAFSLKNESIASDLQRSHL